MARPAVSIEGNPNQLNRHHDAIVTPQPGQGHPADRSLTGLIDFGDSYVSHPALDLHRWPDTADRLTLREGYLAGSVPTADFDAAWIVAMIYTDLAVVASRPELAQAQQST